MAKYKKRKDGRYQANIILGKDGKTGKYIQKIIYAPTIRELEEKKAKIVTSLSDGTYADDKHTTVYKYALQWLQAEKQNKSASTYNGYHNIIQNHLGNLADMELLQVKRSDVLIAIAALEGHYDLQRRLRMTLNQIFESAIDDGMLYKNVCRNIPIGKKPKTAQRNFTELEKQAILTADLDEREEIFVLLLYYTGMRCGEILALDHTCINFHTGSIHVQAAVSLQKNQPIIKSPKTEAGNRYISILTPLQKKLHTYVTNLKKNGGYYLFAGPAGEPFSKTIYRRFWKKIRNKIQDRYERISSTGTASAGTTGITVVFDYDGMTPHRFRHNFATMLHDAGVDAKEAQIILGHSDVRVTLDIYTHLDDQKALPMEKMERFLKKMS